MKTVARIEAALRRRRAHIDATHLAETGLIRTYQHAGAMKAVHVRVLQAAQRTSDFLRFCLRRFPPLLLAELGRHLLVKNGTSTHVYLHENQYRRLDPVMCVVTILCMCLRMTRTHRYTVTQYQTLTRAQWMAVRKGRVKDLLH